MSDESSALITTHVLDTARGAPAAGIARPARAGRRPAGRCRSRTASPTTTAGSRELGPARLEPGTLPPGVRDRRLPRRARDRACFFPEVVVTASPDRRRTGTTTCRCCSARSPTRPTGGADDGHRRSGPTSTARPRPASSGSTATRARHEIRDLNVSTALRGDFAAAHLAGDQAHVLPTDTQKNTVFAFAKEHGVGADRGVRARAGPALRRRRRAGRGRARRRRGVRLGAGHRRRRPARPHLGPAPARRSARPRSRSRRGPRRGRWSPACKDLVVLKSTGSEFRGFLTDAYTTLPETNDRVLATSLVAEWRARRAPTSTGARPGRRRPRGILVERFAAVHSLALQQTLWEMGSAVLEAAARGRRDPPVGAEHAPLPGRPVAVRARQPRRGLLRRRPAVRADPGQRRPRRRRGGR